MLQLSKISTLRKDSVDYVFLEKSLLVLCEKLHLSILKEALEDQSTLVRRLGVKVSELSDIEGQSDITSYF